MLRTQTTTVLEPEIRILALFGTRVVFGQERANLETLAALKERGCAVLCVVRDEDWPELVELRRMIERIGLEWVAVPYIDYPVRGWIIHTLLRNPGAFVRANRALPRIARRFRATHIHAFNPLYVASFWLALRRLRLPMIYRAGDRPTQHNAFYRGVWRFIVRRSCRFVADSRFIAAALSAIGVRAADVDVVYAPPPRRDSVIGSETFLSNEATTSFCFVIASQITREKGVGIAVEAFSRLADRFPAARLLIAGPISDWSGHAWARQLRDDVAAEARLKDRIGFLGLVEDVPRLMRACRVHLNPSQLEEAYGLVVVEAKQAGIPSIIFPKGGMQELVVSGRDGFVVEDVSAAGLAAAMETYLLDPALAATHGAAARRSIEDLGLGQFGDRWLTVYQRSLVRGNNAWTSAHALGRETH